VALEHLKKILVSRRNLPPDWGTLGSFYYVRIYTKWGSICRICRKENIRVKVGGDYIRFCPDCDVEDGVWGVYPTCENCRRGRIVINAYGHEKIYCLKCGSYLGLRIRGVEYSLRLL